MEFREYKIKDILLIEQIKNKFKDTKEVELQPVGNYPVITQGTGERYIQKYINTYRENGNVITYSFCGETWATYQPSNFSGVGSKIGKITIKNKMLTENLALYLVSCINNLSGSARAFQQVPDKLGSNSISLPSIIHDDGTFEPDWDYMENYIKELKEKVNIYTQTEVNVIDNVKKHRNEKIDVSEWKEYNYKDIFKDSPMTRVDPEKLNIVDRKDKINNVGIITLLDTNNQIKAWCASKKFSSGNCISLNCFSGRFSYQKDNIIKVAPADNFPVITLKNKILTENIAFFLVVMLNKTTENLSISRQNKLTNTKLYKLRIFLPSIIHEDGTFEPDWDYMENYIKGLKGENHNDL